MEQFPIAVVSARNLHDSRKLLLEEILGQQLEENQQVFIMAFTPGVVPSDDARRQARAGLEQTWAQVEKHMADHGITGEEFDTAVDEAIEHVRGREA